LQWVNLKKHRRISMELTPRRSLSLREIPIWGAGITLARAEIAVRRGNYVQAQQYIESVRPVFSRPDAEAYQRAKVDQRAAIVGSRPK
jgi:hypothetical protein